MDFLILRTKGGNDLGTLFDFELKCSHLSVKGNFSSLPSHSFVCFCLSLNLNIASIDTLWYFILCFIKEIWDAKDVPGSQLVYNKWWRVLKPDQLGITALECMTIQQNYCFSGLIRIKVRVKLCLYNFKQQSASKPSWCYQISVNNVRENGWTFVFLWLSQIADVNAFWGGILATGNSFK